MSDHFWCDEWPYFRDVGEAAFKIGQFLKKYGRVNVTQTKEKYGGVRVYCSFGWYQLHNITHPGYVWSRYPDWLWKLDCYYFSKLIQLLNIVIVPYHQWLYRLAYKKMIKKYPHIKEEILEPADYPELLEGL